MSDTIFRLQRTSDFTTPWQNVNISLYVLHFIQSCCELRRLQEIPLPAPCRKSHCLGPAGNPIAWALQRKRKRERERERDREATTESEKERKSDRETEIHATQCCSTRAVNGQVRKCNLMCLLCCSCEHVEMRRNGYHNEYHTMQCSQHMTMASNIPIHITMTPSITPTTTSMNKISCHKKACA